MSVPSRVLKQYDLGQIRSQTQLTDGLIHQTYRINTSTGRFIAQQLHPILASQEIAKDFLAITSFLNEQGFPAPECVLTKRGQVLAKDGKQVWRLQTFLQGKTNHVLRSTAQAREAGRIYARLHATLDPIPHRFRSKIRFHETRKILSAFKNTVRAHRHDPLTEAARTEIELVLRELPTVLLPTDLPKRVIHGDPKISNILFDARGRAAAVVDLDTANRHTILVELGDAFRSWCGVQEDDPQNHFRLSIFRAAWGAYRREATFLTSRERALVPQAIQCIALELAARFLTDYFNDSYFGWDKKQYPSRRAHNLARARGQIALYLDIKRRATQLKRAL